MYKIMALRDSYVYPFFKVLWLGSKGKLVGSKMRFLYSISLNESLEICWKSIWMLDNKPALAKLDVRISKWLEDRWMKAVK